MRKLFIFCFVVQVIIVRAQFSLGQFNPYFFNEAPEWQNPSLSLRNGVPQLFVFEGTSILSFPRQPVFYGLMTSAYLDYGIGLAAKFYQQRAGFSRNTGGELSFLYQLHLAGEKDAERAIKLIFSLSAIGEQYRFMYDQVNSNNHLDPILQQQIENIPSFNGAFGLSLVSQNSFFLGIHADRLISFKENYLDNQIQQPIPIYLSTQGGIQKTFGMKHMVGLRTLFTMELKNNHFYYEGNLFYTWNGTISLSAGYQSFPAITSSLSVRLMSFTFGYQASFSPWADVVNNQSSYMLLSHGIILKKLFNEQKPVR
ncbi:MAG: type IX secretion system membrane protein PorP/SprF [Bacteroidales bacterium]|nr:type IX secretion system membrane protein PorP/SprF [Bacteroidales bacterium]